MAKSPKLPFDFDDVFGPGMSPFERVDATINGEETDRPPVCFWHHFQPHGSGIRLAQQTMEFFERMYELDIVKLMPDIPYPMVEKGITDPEEWRKFEYLDPVRSHFITQRRVAVQRLTGGFGDAAPVVVTVFSPLHELLTASASAELVVEQARENPALVHEALLTIAGNIRYHNQVMLEAGADGIFFAIHGCTKQIMGEELYREFGRPYDLMALGGAAGGWLNILHVHGDSDLLIDLVLDYPVAVLSWSDRKAGPSLRDLRTRTNKVLMGGWNETGAIAAGDAAGMRREARDALKQTGGKGFILAPGCSVPDDISPVFLATAREIAESLAE